MVAFQAGRLGSAEMDAAYADAIRDTIRQLELTGSPVITDGEQSKPSFATYPLAGLKNLAPDGVVIPFADGHVRQLPRLTAGPFRYGVHAGSFTDAARRYTQLPLKQAVISASALSLLYPQAGIPNYPREAFLADLLDEAAADIRGAFEAGAAVVQTDFTEAGELQLFITEDQLAFLDDVICTNHIVQAVLMMSKPATHSEFPALVLFSLMHMGLAPRDGRP